jgi:MYXO-CTERM domain-containing protein
LDQRLVARLVTASASPSGGAGGAPGGSGGAGDGVNGPGSVGKATDGSGAVGAPGETATGARAGAAGRGADDAKGASDDSSGCGCRLTPASPKPLGVAFLIAALLLSLRSATRRARPHGA